MVEEKQILVAHLSPREIEKGKLLVAHLLQVNLTFGGAPTIKYGQHMGLEILLLNCYNRPPYTDINLPSFRQ